MKNVLMVMHARKIRRCLEAIDSLRIEKVWFKGYTEAQLVSVINRFIEETDYDNYFIISDDGLPTQEALEKIEAEMGREVVMGWSEYSPGSRYSNVRTKPLVGWYMAMQKLRLWLVRWGQRAGLGRIVSWIGTRHNPFVMLGAPISEVKRQPRIFRTYFNGWSLTGMSRKMWLRYPFSLESEIGNQKVFGSDYSVSRRMNDDGVPMWCIRDAHIGHLHSMEGFFVGKVKPEVVFDYGLRVQPPADAAPAPRIGLGALQ